MAAWGFPQESCCFSFYKALTFQSWFEAVLPKICHKKQSSLQNVHCLFWRYFQVFHQWWVWETILLCCISSLLFLPTLLDPTSNPLYFQRLLFSSKLLIKCCAGPGWFLQHSMKNASIEWHCNRVVRCVTAIPSSQHTLRQFCIRIH